MSRSKGLVGLWILIFIVLTLVAVVLAADSFLGNPVTNFFFKTLLRTPLRIKADVQVKAQMQDNGRNVTTLLLMDKTGQSYGEIMAEMSVDGIDDVKPNHISGVAATLDLVKIGASLKDEKGETVWEHGETFDDSQSMDMALPGLVIGRLLLQ